MDSKQEQNNFSKGVLIVIPVYNHCATLRDVASRCLEQHPDVLVVDDGSTEDVSGALDGLDVTVIRHDQNRGKGQAILTASRWAAENNKTHILTIDADGQHYPEQIPDFLEAVNKTPNAVVIGVRNFEDSDAPFSSRFGRSFGNFWVRIQTGKKVHDIQSGYRVYPVVVLNDLHFMFHTYAFEDEVVVRASWAGIPIREVPIKVFYATGSERVSHFNKFRDNVRLSILNAYLTLRCVIPWPHLKFQYENEKFLTIRHPIHILKTLLEKHDTPTKLALSGFLGVFLGALPLIACHTIVTMFTAAHLRLNKIIAIAAGQICMPPFVPALCIEIGYFLRFGKFLTLENVSSLSQASFLELGSMGLQRLLDWFLGALIAGPVLGIIAGIIIFILSINIRSGIQWMHKTTTK